ncbi:MAG: hypothetical protein WBP81_28450 [Solirubrobacteraceae bacterium]
MATLPDALDELDDADPDELVPELELELLEPHAAIVSAAATSKATALMRLVCKAISFLRYRQSLWGSHP